LGVLECSSLYVDSDMVALLFGRNQHRHPEVDVVGVVEQFGQVRSDVLDHGVDVLTQRRVTTDGVDQATRRCSAAGLSLDARPGGLTCLTTASLAGRRRSRRCGHR